MLRGDVIELRPVRDADLATLYELMTNLDTRGPYFPLGVMSEPAFRAAFAKNGFWDADEGMLVMVKDGEIVGEIEYFPITHYLQGYEISYQLFGDQHAGRGYTSDAVRLLVGYVFGRKRVNRMQLNIHPGQCCLQARRPEVRLHLRGEDAWLLVPPRRVPRPGGLVDPAGRSRRPERWRGGPAGSPGLSWDDGLYLESGLVFTWLDGSPSIHCASRAGSTSTPAGPRCPMPHLDREAAGTMAQLILGAGSCRATAK